MKTFKSFIGCSPIDSGDLNRVSHKDYNRFIHNSVKQLRDGEAVMVFNKEQLEVLQEKFKDENLVVLYDTSNNWWTCYLNFK